MKPEDIDEKTKKAIGELCKPVVLQLDLLAQQLGMCVSAVYCKGYDDGQRARLIGLPGFRN